jgi:hypothetical protein
MVRPPQNLQLIEEPQPQRCSLYRLVIRKKINPAFTTRFVSTC